MSADYDFILRFNSELVELIESVCEVTRFSTTLPFGSYIISQPRFQIQSLSSRKGCFFLAMLLQVNLCRRLNGVEQNLSWKFYIKFPGFSENAECTSFWLEVYMYDPFYNLLILIDVLTWFHPLLWPSFLGHFDENSRTGGTIPWSLGSPYVRTCRSVHTY